MSREPALLTSAGRMPERSQHRVSEGQRAPIRLGGLVDVANVRRRGVGSPEPSLDIQFHPRLIGRDRLLRGGGDRLGCDAEVLVEGRGWA
jgi:hypothetical protein